MSFVLNTADQISLEDSFGSLTPREKRFLNKSWAKYFGDNLFPKIDEEPFRVLYSANHSRPNCPVNILIGALVLKELTGLSDDELMMSLMFDVRYQYALHTTSYTEQPISDRSLGRFRERCATHETSTGVDLIGNAVRNLSNEMAKIMKIDRTLKRMDSMMVASNIRKLSRLELIYTVCANLVKELNENKETIPETLKHFIEDGDRNTFIYHNKSEETGSKMEKLLREAKELKEFAEPRYDESGNFQMLIRVLREQTVEENGEFRLRTKEDGGMDSNILQNPADPDATFRSKAGKDYRGYAANLVESTNEMGQTIIEDFQFEKNNYSDSNFLADKLEKMGEQEEKVTIIADGGYSGEGTQALAESNNVEIVNTNLSGKEPDAIAADFEFSDDGTKVIKCPGGHEPKSCSYNKTTGQCHCSFERECCEFCPYRDQCHPKEHKKTFRKVISRKSHSRALQNKKRETNEFKKYCHFRNGVETLPSVLRRKYRVDRMPVRGLIRSKMFFGFKIAALNFNKFCKHLQSLDSCALVASN